jgi:hypothetical protein
MRIDDARSFYRMQSAGCDRPEVFDTSAPKGPTNVSVENGSSSAFSQPRSNIGSIKKAAIEDYNRRVEREGVFGDTCASFDGRP